MEDFLPIIIFLLVMITSLIRAAREAQRKREKQEHEFTEQRKSQFDHETAEPQVIPPGEEVQPKIPRSFTDLRQVLEKELLAEEEQEVKPGRIQTLPPETSFPEAKGTPTEFIANKEEPPPALEYTRYGRTISKPSAHKDVGLLLPLPFSGRDAVRGIIYNEVFGLPISLRDQHPHRE